MVDLSIIIVSFNTKDFLEKCINSVEKNAKGIEYEIIVVDNGSEDESREYLKKLQSSSVKVIFSKANLGFANGNNQGTKVSCGKYVLYLNSDTLILDNVLSEMVNWMDKNQKVGAASCMLKGKYGSLQGTGGYFPTLTRVFSWMTIQDIPGVDFLIKPFHPFHGKSFFGKGESFYLKKKELDWVTGAFLLARKEVIDEVEGWDEEYFMYMEEVDLCYRIKKAGWEVWYLPRWGIIHYGGKSSTSEFPLLAEYNGVKLFYKKHFSSWQYPILRFLLKLGALGRIVLFGILEGKEAAKIYAKAFIQT